MAKKLEEQGFKQSIQDKVICRWRYDDVILDVMPTNEEILTFGNRWYKEALQNSIIHNIAEDLVIKSITAPYLLATKIEAFNTRGNNDFFGSHDFEDIIAVIAGRIEITEEVAVVNKELRSHLKKFFAGVIKNNAFQQALPGHVSDGPVTMQRVQTVIDRIKKIIGVTTE